jgi:glutamyl-tRNA synthetase
MIALLGWNPGTEQEILSLDELVSLFSMERVGKSGSKFDPEKAKWFNHKYLVEKSDTDLAGLFKKVLDKKGVLAEDDFLLKVVSLVKERANFVDDFWAQSSFFFEAPAEYDQQVVKKRWKEGVPEMMGEIKNLLLGIPVFSAEIIKADIMKFTEEKNISLGVVMNALRLVLVGGGFGPDLAQIAEMLGKEEVIRRIDAGINNIS